MKLRKILAELEAELSSGRALDAESRALLLRARDAIDRALGGEAEPAEQLRELLASFGARHPTLTTAVNRLAEALAEMGF